MAPQVLMRSPPATRRQTYLLHEETKPARKGKKFGEVAGGTAAECTAVCCCCPCSVMELLILGLYKLPTGLCRKAWKRRKRRHSAKKRQNLLGLTKSEPTREDLEAELNRIVGNTGHGLDGPDDAPARAVDLDKEMWERFYGTGFWRSPSQREL